MGSLIEIPPADYFGNCPKCGGNDGHLDIGPDHWCFCIKHRSKWWIGSDNLLYRNESSDDKWEINIKKLAGYKEVSPLYRYSRI